jgi:predicted metalloprotease
VQNQLGIMDRVNEARAGLSQEQSNQLSVMVELQADCFAGVWANHAQSQRSALEPGDIEEGLNAAAAVGDDRLQRRSQGYVVPESFTHGTSEQRVAWFRRGFENGDPDSCDTFNSQQL